MSSRLGQHFLKSKKIARRIIEAAGIKKNDVILEVGPGKGILTEELLKYAKQVIAVEKDKRLISFLEVNFRSDIHRGNLTLINDDILQISNFKFLPKSLKTTGIPVEDLGIISKQIPNPKSQNFRDYKVVANIPYYITSRFLRNFLSAKNQPQKMVLMVQKEVAERINATPPRMNLLAISVQVYGKPKILFNVLKKQFLPQPKVDSAVILIDDISRKFFYNFSEHINFQHINSYQLRHGVVRATNRKVKKIEESEFFKLVKIGFSHKRKLLLGNLSKIKKKEALEQIFKKCGIPLKSRAENLALSDWKCLVENI